MDIRLADRNDLAQLQVLHNKYLSENVNEKNKKDGFLNCDPFSDDDFYAIIEQNEIVVVCDDNQLIGYYLFDNFSKTKTLNSAKEKIEKLLHKGLFGTAKISCRAQSVIDIQHQNKGLSKIMLSKIIDVTKDKYDILFSSVDKKNPKLIAHQKSGWNIVDEDEDTYYVTYYLVK